MASLAVAFGSAHGVYVKQPKLSIKRLQEINAATDTPLVLHGGSGIPEDQLAAAFENGINKFNVGTEFFMLNAKLNREALEKGITNSIASCTLMVELGRTIYFSHGSEKNIKLTTPEDIDIFRALLMLSKSN